MGERFGGSADDFGVLCGDAAAFRSGVLLGLAFGGSFVSIGGSDSAVVVRRGGVVVVAGRIEDGRGVLAHSLALVADHA
ncbi:hypothetical protein ACWGJ9_09590 [Curtobacterium citreum]